MNNHKTLLGLVAISLAATAFSTAGQAQNDYPDIRGEIKGNRHGTPLRLRIPFDHEVVRIQVRFGQRVDNIRVQHQQRGRTGGTT